MESRLLASVGSVERDVVSALTDSTHLQAYESVPDFISLLRTSPAARSDEVLAEVMRLRSTWPAFVDSLLVLVFVPMLHRTVRRVVAYQSMLAEEDVAQQALSVLLEFLQSEDMRFRKSHFAFAISRAINRQVFAWAAREGMKAALLDYGADVFPPMPIDEPFERHAQLRHFLRRCVARGDLTDSELDLLVQFKLEGAKGSLLHLSNETVSNAVRQKHKRLLAKLRRLAS